MTGQLAYKKQWKSHIPECWRASSTLLCALLVRDACHNIGDDGCMSGGAIYTLGDALGFSMSPMWFSPNFRDGGNNDPWSCVVSLLCHKNWTLHPIGIGRGDARPKSAREDNGDKNERSGCGIVSDDDQKIRVGDQFIKNWANYALIPAP